MHTVDEVVSLLSVHHQRATYEAVARVVGAAARSVMSRRPHSHRDSWVVSKEKITPSGYLPHEIDPALRERSHVITTGAELAAWLRAPS